MVARVVTEAPTRSSSTSTIRSSARLVNAKGHKRRSPHFRNPRWRGANGEVRLERQRRARDRRPRAIAVAAHAGLKVTRRQFAQLRPSSPVRRRPVCGIRRTASAERRRSRSGGPRARALWPRPRRHRRLAARRAMCRRYTALPLRIILLGLKSICVECSSSWRRNFPVIRSVCEGGPRLYRAVFRVRAPTVSSVRAPCRSRALSKESKYRSEKPQAKDDVVDVAGRLNDPARAGDVSYLPLHKAITAAYQRRRRHNPLPIFVTLPFALRRRRLHEYILQ
ncbi:hypothetical protein EVAR_103155_1 [Eumeta japonica]|uniref:Uncharacterized protein n=1 Tax=Eumeta variegata TaxID=151549 RepID=A0A4C1YH14_EUMVA|nr:hypothetical protein EVAR_103155_1 [Eumeta japonica]